MPGGSEGPTGSSGDSSGSGGEVGSFPGGGDESDGVPPPPSSSGGDGEAGGDAGSSGGDSDEPSDWDEEAASEGECGDTGELPGGVGGMGQDGECIGGGASASESDDSSASGSGGGAEGSVQGTGGACSVGEFPDESDAERAERLGRELEKSVGGFDEVLQEEQREIASAGRNTEGFGGGAVGSGDGGISLGQQAPDANSPVVVANTPGMSRESPIDSMSEQEIRERTPEDIPIMVDDDIIARQLREAALAEDDPALRERLWAEYRKYSGN